MFHEKAKFNFVNCTFHTVIMLSMSDPFQQFCMTLIKHGTSVDEVFPDWLQMSMDAQDCYSRFDMNLPSRLPWRTGKLQDYTSDPPITKIARGLSMRMGHALSMADLSTTCVYSSPALKCVETAWFLMRTMNANAGSMGQICIEPGLFDAAGAYKFIPK